VLLDQTIKLRTRMSRQFKIQHRAIPASIPGAVQYRALLEGAEGAPEVAQVYPLLFAHRLSNGQLPVPDQARVFGKKRLVSGDQESCATHGFSFRLANDGSNLIILADVNDDMLNLADDGIEVMFDCRRPGDLRNGAYAKGCGSVRLLPCYGAGFRASVNPCLEEIQVLDLDFSGSTVAVESREGGYVLQAHIPLSGLFRYEGQHLIGFDIQQVSHHQSGELQVHLAWNGNERTRRFTPGMGLLFVE